MVLVDCCFYVYCINVHFHKKKSHLKLTHRGRSILLLEEIIKKSFKLINVLHVKYAPATGIAKEILMAHNQKCF